MSDAGLGNINFDTNRFQQNIERIENEATTPVAPNQHPEPASGARLEDADFTNRTLDGGISSFDPANSGFNFRVGGSITNVPFIDIMDGIDYMGQDDVNPLGNPMLQDYNSSAGVSVSARVNQENWSLGIRANGVGAASTNGLNQNIPTFASLAEQAEGLESSFGDLETKINDINNRINNSEDLQRLQEIVNGMDVTNINPAELQELKDILNSGEIQNLLNDMNSTLGDVSSTMGEANNALRLLGDGTRTITGDAAVRGAVEVTGGYRTPRAEFGDSGWGIRGGIEGMVIVPLPNPVAGETPDGLPEFKSMMAKVSARVQVTTSGIEQLANRIDSIKGNLDNLNQAVNDNKDALDDAADIAGQIDPNDQSTIWGNLGDILNTKQQLEGAAQQMESSANDLNQNLEGLNEDMDNVSVQTSVGITTSTPTAPVGFGIRDIGATIDGPLGHDHHLSFSTGFLNPVGYLQGERNFYNLAKNGQGDYQLEHVGKESANVFHDFYDPTFYTGARLTFNESTWYRTDLDFRYERSLTADVNRGAAIARQQLGPVSLRTGVVDTDLSNIGTNTMYMGGIGFGSMKHPDIVTFDAATNGFTADTATNVMGTANLNIPF